MPSPLTRDLTTWLGRIQECRNPLLWLSAFNYEQQRKQLLHTCAPQAAHLTATYLREVEDDAVFLTEVRARLSAYTSYKPRAIDFMMSGNSGSVFFNEVTFYALVRLTQPEIMIETGGTPGKSTAFILRAMQRNGRGHLYTIDLAPLLSAEAALSDHKSWHQATPAGATSNWVVPEDLKTRHTLLLGKSSEQLPPLLAKLDQVDIFLHDSDHSYENMMWEFETTLPKIKAGGLLLSDDVLANTSFFDFCQSKSLNPTHVFNLGAARHNIP